MNCLICGSCTESFIDEQFDVKFWACPACEAIFRAKEHLLSPDQEKARYDLHTNSIDDQGYVEYLTNFLNKAALPAAAAVRRSEASLTDGDSTAAAAVRKFTSIMDSDSTAATKEKRGLDYGSGPAPVLSQILELDYGYKMDVYDPFYAPERSFEGKKYDLITCTEVAEHVKDPLELFETLAKHLAYGGILALMTAFHQNERQHFLNWFYSRDPTHIVFYTPKTMQVIAAQCGLRIIHCDNINSITFTTT